MPLRQARIASVPVVFNRVILLRVPTMFTSIQRRQDHTTQQVVHVERLPQTSCEDRPNLLIAGAQAIQAVQPTGGSPAPQRPALMVRICGHPDGDGGHHAGGSGSSLSSWSCGNHYHRAGGSSAGSWRLLVGHGARAARFPPVSLGPPPEVTGIRNNNYRYVIFGCIYLVLYAYFDAFVAYISW